MAKIKKKAVDKGKKSFVIWMTIIGVLLVGSYTVFMAIRSKPPRHSLQAGKHESLQAVEDPVCGMMVKPPAAGHIEYRAKHYYFCSVACKEDFEKEPEKYLKGKDIKEMK